MKANSISSYIGTGMLAFSATLGQAWMGGVQAVGDHQPQHRVAEKLQTLVVGQSAVLIGVRTMGQGSQKQRLVDRLIDHREQVGDQTIHGPLQRAVPARGVRRTHARVLPDQLWCSLRSATP